jgi:hypothetical protein
MKLWRDFGVSALLATITTGGTVFIILWLAMHGQTEEAGVLAGPLILMSKMFYEGYLAKREKDQNGK